MKLISKYASLALIVAVIVALDQWTKSLVREHIPFGGSWLPDGLAWLQPYARIVHWYNTGAAFGMLQGFGIVFAVLAVVVSLAIVYYYPQVDDRDWWLKLALGMQMAGALGNLIDRLMLDMRVTDFISVGSFPVFNVADSSVTVGVVILLVGVWFKEAAEKRKAAAAGPAPAAEGEEPVE